MRHAILTCKNHPKLRWSAKEIAVNPNGNGGLGSYTGSRNIFFNGELRVDAANRPIWYADGSGVQADTYICENGQPRIVEECNCPPTDLILAEEDPRVWEK